MLSPGILPAEVLRMDGTRLAIVIPVDGKLFR